MKRCKENDYYVCVEHCTAGCYVIGMGMQSLWWTAERAASEKSKPEAHADE